MEHAESPGRRRGRVRALLLAAAKQREAQALTLATNDAARSLFAPYSPSPARVIHAVWERLAQLAVALQPDELLVDLGCGDGRWLVSGVQQFGCRALGIELDPVLVRTAKANVAAAALADRIDVVEADIMKVSIRAAHLVIVYAFAESLHGIREYLMEQLSARALVLSIGFRVPDWKPRWADRVDGLPWYLYEIQSACSDNEDGHRPATTTPTAAPGAA